MISPVRVSSAAPTLNFEYGATALSRALAAARISCELLTLAIKLREIFQQRGGLCFHAFRCFQTFCVRQFLFCNARREIRDAGNSRYVQSALPRGNGFGYRAHSDRIRTEPGERAHFRRGFIARSAYREIDAGAKFDSARASGAVQEPTQI